VGDGLLHDPGALYDLGQEHPPGPEQVADHVHAGHQRALDDVEGPRGDSPGFLGVLDDPGVDAFDEGVGQALADGPVALHILGSPISFVLFLLTALSVVSAAYLELKRKQAAPDLA